MAVDEKKEALMPLIFLYKNSTGTRKGWIRDDGSKKHAQEDRLDATSMKLF